MTLKGTDAQWFVLSGPLVAGRYQSGNKFVPLREQYLVAGLDLFDKFSKLSGSNFSRDYHQAHNSECASESRVSLASGSGAVARRKLYVMTVTGFPPVSYIAGGRLT
jgi:hypothetical protein